MVGDRIRQRRQLQRLSLSDVAETAKISAATLSRIETGKQSLTLDLFLLLAGILQIAPEELLGDGERPPEPEELAERIVVLPPDERSRLWRELAAHRRRLRRDGRTKLGSLSAHVDELVAQIEFIREELSTVQQHLAKLVRPGRRSQSVATARQVIGQRTRNR
jgi:transcriptional regulator with XRE-family HTH domain